MSWVVIDVTLQFKEDADKFVRLVAAHVLPQFPTEQMHGSTSGSAVRLQVMLRTPCDAALLERMRKAIVDTIEGSGIYFHTFSAQSADHQQPPLITRVTATRQPRR